MELLCAGDRSGKKNRSPSRLGRASISASDTVEDVDATLAASDADDVREDDGGDDADSDDEVVSGTIGNHYPLEGLLAELVAR